MDDALAELEWVRALFTEVVIPDQRHRTAQDLVQMDPLRS